MTLQHLSKGGDTLASLTLGKGSGVIFDPAWLKFH